jgi:tetratricopeptide (TPR) repeat protein
LGKYRESIDAFETVLKSNPRHKYAWYGMGWSYCKLGAIKANLDKSLDCFEKAIEINPKFGYAWYSKGVILDLLGQSDDADEAYLEARMLGVDTEKLAFLEESLDSEW